MSIMDDVRLGAMLLRPAQFQGTNVLVEVYTVEQHPDVPTEEESTPAGTKEPEQEGPGGFVVPIRTWETLALIPGKLAAYEAQFAPPEAQSG